MLRLSKYIPSSFSRFDQYLLRRYPTLWRTQGHTVLFLVLVVGNLIAWGLAWLLPLYIDDLPKNYQIEDQAVFVSFLLFAFGVLGWGINQSKFKFRGRFFHALLGTGFIYLVGVFAFFSTTITYVKAREYKISQLLSVEELTQFDAAFVKLKDRIFSVEEARAYLKSNEDQAIFDTFNEKKDRLIFRFESSRNAVSAHLLLTASNNYSDSERVQIVDHKIPIKIDRISKAKSHWKSFSHKYLFFFESNCYRGGHIKQDDIGFFRFASLNFVITFLLLLTIIGWKKTFVLLFIQFLFLIFGSLLAVFDFPIISVYLSFMIGAAILFVLLNKQKIAGDMVLLNWLFFLLIIGVLAFDAFIPCALFGHYFLLWVVLFLGLITSVFYLYLKWAALPKTT